VSVVRIVPGPLRGRCRAPASKSYTHRALVVAHLARRRYRVVRPLDSDDTRATAAALEALGSRVVRSPEEWVVTPRSDRNSTAPCTIDCGESGTTLRFVAALAAVSGRRVRITGRGRLPFRPIEPLLEGLRRLGATCERRGTGRTLPVSIEGPIDGGRVSVDANQSSQFASALLLVSPILTGSTTLRLRGRIVSEPYLEATEAVLRESGVRFSHRGPEYRIPGGQAYRGSLFRVPGDASSAAYLWAGAALTTGPVTVSGIPDRWPQADLAILDLLSAAGARVRRGKGGVSVAAAERHPFSIDLTRCPDLYPLAGVIGAVTPGTSRLLGAPQIVLKESDRRKGTEELVAKLGGRTRRTSQGLEIRGLDAPAGFALRNAGDHRMVMSAAVAALTARAPSTIGNADVVRKSFPGFWGALSDLRGEEVRS
jgi:3-phosphoshikimate 1-carboxyvinyltransferase